MLPFFAINFHLKINLKRNARQCRTVPNYIRKSRYLSRTVGIEPLVSKTENPKFITSRRPTSTAGKFDKVQNLQDFFIVDKKKEFDVLTAFITKCHHIFNCLHRRQDHETDVVDPKTKFFPLYCVLTLTSSDIRLLVKKINYHTPVS